MNVRPELSPRDSIKGMKRDFLKNFFVNQSEINRFLSFQQKK
jgi:hypothetical protein